MTIRPLENPASPFAWGGIGKSPVAAHDFSHIPLMATRKMNLPPAYLPAPTLIWINKSPTVDGVPLGQSNKPMEDYLWNPPSDQASPDPTGIYDQSKFGNSASFVINLVANQPQRALTRPPTTRLQLTVQNQNAAGNLFYDFDRPANANAAIFIIPGGNRLWDAAVPQGDLWLVSPVNCVVAVEYINKDIKTA